MSHFYGTVQGQAGEASRRGSKSSGITTYAASSKGAIRVEVYQNDQGNDAFLITQERWHGTGVSETIAAGILGEPVRTGKPLIDALATAQPELRRVA